MFKRFLKRFGKKPARIEGTREKLAEGESKVVDLGDPLAGGVQVVVSRIEGQVYALDTRCPHEGGRLVGGPLVEGSVLCPLHNYLFDPRAGGKVVRGVCASAKSYEIQEDETGCDVWI